MTAVAVVQTPRSKLQTASGEPDTAFAAANGTVSRSSPPKKRASRAEAQDRAEARAGHTPVQPKPDTVSRTARQTRDSPKQVEPCSPRSAGSPRTASAEPGAPACRYQRPKPRHQLTERRSNASTTFAQRRTQSSEIQYGSSAVSSPRQRDRHITVHRRSDVPHDPVRPVASSVTAVQAHPSRSTHYPKTARRTSHPVKLFEHTRCSKSPHVSAAEAAGTWRPSLDSLSQTRRLAATSVTRSSIRASGQKDAPSDEHDTVRSCPKAAAHTCSSPPVGVRRHLPWGSLPFDGISVGDRCAPDYLPGTFRSQGFSPSQRFDPTDTSWLCFTPHPSIGFRPSELFPRSQPSRLSTRHALLSFLRRTTHRSKPMGRTCGDFRALLQLRIRHPPQRV